MRDNASKLFFLCAIACGALIAVHVAQKRGASKEAATQAAESAAASRRAQDGAERDLKAREEWREKMRPAAGDSRDVKAEKEFSRSMRLLGDSPIEVDGEIGGRETLAGFETSADLKKVLEEGGHYSGPLPPELIDVAKEGK